VSGRRVAALAALIIVPVAILAIVLASLLDSGDSRDSGAGPAQTQTTSPPPPQKPSAGSAGAGGVGGGGRTLGKSGGAALPLLDRGSPPKKLSQKLGPESSGGTITLDQLRGAPVVLNVWSSNCIPCRAEARVLQSEWDRLGRRGVLFLGLDVADTPAAARSFRQQYDVTYPSLEEKRGATAKALGATGVPETFFLSKRGKIVGHVVGGLTLGQLELGVRAAQTGRQTGTDQGAGRVPLP
jgi:cytochrome c biogenesis protein CcmG, thiol:disulfide interchange protein DsbE